MIDVSMKKYTTYKLEGNIKEIVFPKNTKELIDILKKLKDSKHMVLGNGSNVVFVGDYDGTIIKLDNFNELLVENNIVTVGAGYSLPKLSLLLAQKGLSGLEFASSIPGTIGGSIYGNAGAYNKSMADVVEEVYVLDNNYKIKKLTNKEMKFGYRKSILQENKFICLKVVLKLEFKPQEEIMKVINERKERRLLTQPLEFPSAGSVFRNPEGNYAGKIIEDLGLKGTNVGDAYVSEKHANFIINKGHASGKDIKQLVELIKEKTKEAYNIELIAEQQFIE